jgi:hypothetical protein
MKLTTPGALRGSRSTQSVVVHSGVAAYAPCSTDRFRGVTVQRKWARLAWASASVVIGLLAAAEAWQGETTDWLSWSDGVPLTPYYLTVFSWTPLVALAWVGAGAVVLARLVRYRGFWYMAPQILFMILMVIRLLALAYERGFPDASQVVLENMTLARWLLVALGGISFAASLGAAVGCMVAAFAHRTGQVA